LLKKNRLRFRKVLDENEKPLSNVSVVILGQQKGIVTSDSGTFRLKVNCLTVHLPLSLAIPGSNLTKEFSIE
jgi:hypothetical protein